MTDLEKLTHMEAEDNALIAHFAELRVRLLFAFFVVVLGFCGFYAVKESVFEWLIQPLMVAENAPAQMVFTAVHEQFFTYLKMAFFGGLFAAFPFVLWQVWRFVAPGLYGHEKRFLAPLMVLTPILFYTGGAFVYWGVMPVAISFFLSFQVDHIVALPSVKEYLSFLVKMAFAFGLAFELPILLLLLVRSGVVSVDQLARGRRYAILAAFVAAAILTPPDPVSQLMLAIPLVFFYEGSLLLARLCKSPKKEADPSE